MDQDLSVLLGELAECFLEIKNMTRGRPGEQTAEHGLMIVAKCQRVLLLEKCKRAIELKEAV